jgi:hypothetical protein
VICHQELYDRRCVASLIHVVEQTPLRAAVRRLLVMHRTSAGWLLLWSLLRWERTFLIQTLERMGVDLWSLTRDVDEALRVCSKQTPETGERGASDDLDPFLRGWLNRAAAQARALGHDFLSGEHLLLALLADGDSELAAVLQRHGLTHDSLKQAVAAALGGAASAAVALGEDGVSSRAEPPATPAASNWIADIDRPAVGVPRRFGVFLMMLMVTLYAFLFSLLRVLQASNLDFGLVALLFTGIGIGQAVLFGGRYPRSASIWTGSILVPIEVCVFALCNGIHLYMRSATMTIVSLLAMFVACIPLGAVVGYLCGTLTAAGFFLVDWYEKRRQPAEKSSAE